jgi:hypothetical protein
MYFYSQIYPRLLAKYHFIYYILIFKCWHQGTVLKKSFFFLIFTQNRDGYRFNLKYCDFRGASNLQDSLFLIGISLIMWKMKFTKMMNMVNQQHYCLIDSYGISITKVSMVIQYNHKVL